MDVDEAMVVGMIERGEIDVDQMLFTVSEDIDIPPGTTDVQAFLADEAKMLGDRLRILKQAHLRFSLLSKVSYNSSLDFERHYRALFDDISKHRQVWFDRFFNVDTENPTRAEFTTGILGTLCTILRQRGDIQGCNEVMQTYMAVLKRYQQMTEKCDREAQVFCCDGLTYKANLIRMNLGAQLPDMQMTVQAFRDAVEYERKYKALGRYDVETEPDYDGVMNLFFGHDRYEELSDDVIFKAFTFMLSEDIAKPALELRKCGCCDKEEELHGDHKKCSRCHQQPYCSKECQVQDWKIHRHLCGNKNKTNIPSDDLLWITKQLVKNHTATVELRTKVSLTATQKDNATLALVKELKRMFTGQYNQYNDSTLVADASQDSSFLADLANFFAKQPGFEKVWGELSVGYKKELDVRKAVKQNLSGTLMLPDDAIRQQCKQIAHSMTLMIGSTLTDGNVSAMMESQNKLVDALVEQTKQFIRKHREFDSYDGLRKVVSHEEFKAEMVGVVGDALGIDFAEE